MPKADDGTPVVPDNEAPEGEELEIEPTDGEASDDDSLEPTGDGDDGQAPNDEFNLDSFVENLDLPEEQKRVVTESLMRQKDYTQKTQEIAKQRKLVEQWSPLIERMIQNPELSFNQVMGVNPNQGGQPQEEEIPQDPKAFAEWVRRQAVEEATREIHKGLSEREDLDRASRLDPRLEGSTESDQMFQEVIAGKVAQDSELLSGRKTYTEAVQDALSWYERYYKTVEKSVHDGLNKRVQDKRAVTPKKSSPMSTTGDVGPTMLDAFKAAKDELGIS